MQTLDLCSKTSGKIWHRKPSPSSDDGLMVDIGNSVSTPLATPGRNIRFLHAAFDSSGESFLAGDHHGNIFTFDLLRNRFALVQKTGHPCTALACNLKRKTEYLVALADYSLKCYDLESKEMVAWMKGHESAIHTLSVHASGGFVVTTSADTAIIFDLDTFQKKRKLNIREDVGILKVFFVPMSNTIISCFRDDSVFAWESETLECKFQLPVPPGKSPHYRAFAATRDGRFLAAGGRSRFIHLWSLDTRRLLRIIELPSKITAVKQLEFLPDSFRQGLDHVLGALCQDGIMRFINIDDCKLLFDMGSVENKINNAVVSSNGRYVVCVMEDGHLHLYSVQALSADINKPPAPLVKVVTSNKMCDTVSQDGSELSQPRSTASQSQTSLGGTQRSTHRSALRSSLHSTKSGVLTANSQEGRATEGLNIEKLLEILKGYGEYPAKYRMFIWRSVLKLPENHAAYAALVDKGIHPAYSTIHEVYPIKSRKLLRVLQRILSALAHWSPIFGETQYLPMLAFPFVKLFHNNHLVCFEIIATLLVNWGQHWFEYFPNPPINVLAMVENVLAHHDRYLLQHFVKMNVTSQIYAWPLLESVFSEVLTKEEWLMLWDNVLSNPPHFLLLVAVAYAICARGPLLQCSELDDFQYFFHHRNAVDVRQVIREAYRLDGATPESIHPRALLEPFTPLTSGQYPVFNKYPKFIVDYQVQERERIRQEEIDYLRQKQMTLTVQQDRMQRQQEEEAWYRQQALLLEAEEKRRRLIQEEEAKLAEQRKRLAAMNREVKIKELQLLDAARQKFLHFQKEQREAELRRLDDEMQRKALLRDQETEAAIEEAEIKGLELQLQKKMLEQELFRDFAAVSQTLRSEKDLHRKQQELEDRIEQRVREAERERELEVRKMMEQNLAKAAQQNVEVWAQEEMEQRRRREDLEKEARNCQLARLHTQNRTLEQEVFTLMQRVEDKKQVDMEAGYRGIAESQEMRAQASAHRMRPPSPEMPDSSHDLDDDPDTVSFDRRSRSFDENEVALVNEVRRLRQRLAMENREKRPPRRAADTVEVY